MWTRSGSGGSFTWNVTFVETLGDVEEIIADGSSLTGTSGFGIATTEEVAGVAPLDGEFVLAFNGDDHVAVDCGIRCPGCASCVRET